MSSWGWRIPFILGAPLGLFGLYLRRHLDESPIFENEIDESEQEQATFRTIIQEHRKDIIVCFIAVAFYNITNYMLLSYMPSYLDEIIGLPSATSTMLITGVMIIMIPLAFSFGRLSDRRGNRRLVLLGLTGLALTSILSFFLIGQDWLLFVGIGIFIIGFFCQFSREQCQVCCQVFFIQMCGTGRFPLPLISQCRSLVGRPRIDLACAHDRRSTRSSLLPDSRQRHWLHHFLLFL